MHESITHSANIVLVLLCYRWLVTHLHTQVGGVLAWEWVLSPQLILPVVGSMPEIGGFLCLGLCKSWG